MRPPRASSSRSLPESRRAPAMSRLAGRVGRVALRLDELRVAAAFGDREHVVERRAQRRPRSRGVKTVAA